MILEASTAPSLMRTSFAELVPPLIPAPMVPSSLWEEILESMAHPCKRHFSRVFWVQDQVYAYGIIPIPLLSYVTVKNKLKAAAYISASHNPPEYNGIRFRTRDGYGILYKETKIMKFNKEGGFRSGEGHLVNCRPANAIDSYQQYVSGKLNFKRSLKVVLDMGNGSASIMTPLMRAWGSIP